MGNTLGIAALLAIIAAVLSFGVSFPARARAGKVAASLAASSDPAEKAKLGLQIDRLQKRATVASVASVGFGLLAASGMAIARYV
jgi:hypothetical protein